MSISANDCVIVSMGCFLPGAYNTQEYLDLLLNNKCQIKPISEKRWKKELNYSPYREQPDKTYSHYGAEIPDDVYVTCRKKWFGEDSNISRMDIMAFEAMEQARSGIKLPSPARVSLILGAMNPDERYFVTRFKTSIDDIDDKLSDYFSEDKHEQLKALIKRYSDRLTQGFEEKTDDLMSTSVLSRLKNKFDIQGRSFIVDAACAAGIASIDLGISYLKNKSADFVFAGGLESNLGQGTYVLFSKVGALSEERCLPFDKRSRGLSQGEGSVIFGLQRYEDAVRMGNPVLGVVRGVGASSDGKVASLFQPDIGGQMLALKRAYTDVDNQRVDFAELHGTGTQVGDYTESESVSLFYKNYEIPVGAVKSLIGHTKATAGAAGVLKCLLAIQNRQLPGSGYIQDSLFSNSDLFINKESINLKNSNHTMKCGISAFGFGGTNFHLLLEQYNPDKSTDTKKLEPEIEQVAFLGSYEIDIDKYQDSFFTDKNSTYKLPPKSLKFIDKTQLLAVYAIDKLLQDVNPPMTQYHKDQTHVYSASTLGLDILNDLTQRIAIDTIIEGIDKDPIADLNETEKSLLLDMSNYLKNIKNGYTPATEESGPGVLNNVIAGRVCNAFNFRGKNLNIDCDIASIPAAIEVICEDIKAGKDGLFLLVGVEESVNESAYKIDRQKVIVGAFSSVRYAKENFLKIKSVMESSHA